MQIATPLRPRPRPHRTAGALAAAALLLSVLTACGDAPPESVLLIIADDVGVDMIGLYGNPADPLSVSFDAPPTPRIDALAASGVVFEQAWSNPVCSSTRAGIYTGQPAYENGVGWALLSGDEGLEVGVPTLPDQIGQRYSALLGKWHLGDADADGTPNAGKALDHGFYDHAGVLGGLPRDSSPPGACADPSGYFCWDKYVNGTELCVTGLESPDCAVGGGAFTRYATLDTTDEALDWIEPVHQHGDPWLAVVAYNAAHSPYEAPDPACLPVGTPAPADDREAFEQMTECLDHEIGRLLDELATLGALQNTTVIFVGDNGTDEDVGNGYYPADHWKKTVYQGGVRVPLIVADGFVLQNAAPDLRQGGFKVVNLGGSVATPVHTQDLFHTIIEIAGQPPLADPEIDSVSLVPYLQSATAAPQRDTVYTESFRGVNGFPCEQAIRGARFKLVRSVASAAATPTEELYQLLNTGNPALSDEAETNDLMLGGLTLLEQAAYDFLSARLPHTCN